MTIPGYELALSQQLGKDRTGKLTASRRFVVQTLSPQTALTSPNVPALNTEHPEDARLRLDRYNISTGSDGVCTVECLYSNDNRFVDLRTPNRDAPTWYHWGWSSRKATIEIPMAVRSQVLATSGDGTQVEKLVWKIAKKQLVEVRVLRPLQVRVVVNDVRVFDAIAKQTDKLHKMPDGGWYHFEGGTVNQVDDAGTYDISYTWEIDYGTFYLPPTNSVDVQYCIPGEDNVPMRYPYTVFATFQKGNPEIDKPTCVLQDLYDRDPEGWRELPGAERII
jgi:hypothetical protein